MSRRSSIWEVNEVSNSEKLSRRTFMRKRRPAGAIGAGVPYFVSAKALGRAGNVGANDRIQLGLIAPEAWAVETCRIAPSTTT